MRNKNIANSINLYLVKKIKEKIRAAKNDCRKNDRCTPQRVNNSLQRFKPLKKCKLSCKNKQGASNTVRNDFKLIAYC